MDPNNNNPVNPNSPNDTSAPADTQAAGANTSPPIDNPFSPSPPGDLGNEPLSASQTSAPGSSFDLPSSPPSVDNPPPGSQSSVEPGLTQDTGSTLSSGLPDPSPGPVSLDSNQISPSFGQSVPDQDGMESGLNQSSLGSAPNQDGSGPVTEAPMPGNDPGSPPALVTPDAFSATPPTPGWMPADQNAVLPTSGVVLPAEQPAAPSEPVPTFTPPAGEPNPLSSPSWSPTASPENGPLSSPADTIGSATASEAGLMPEAAPTDLSHLVDGSQGAETANLPVSTQPESLVVPPTADTSQVVTSSGSRGLPKWIFIVAGAVLFLGVVGASAYFILGVGRPSESTTTSVPAEETTLVNPPRRLLPPEEPVPTQPLGGLTGSTPAATPTVTLGGQSATSSAKTGTSAIDLIRQRQGN